MRSKFLVPQDGVYQNSTLQSDKGELYEFVIRNS